MKTKNKNWIKRHLVWICILIGFIVLPFVNAGCMEYDDYYLVIPGNLYRFENWLSSYPSDYLSYEIDYLSGEQKVGVGYRSNGKYWEDYKGLPLSENRIYHISLYLVTETNGNHLLEIYIDGEYHDRLPLPQGLTSSRLMIKDVINSDYSNIRVCDDYPEPCVSDWNCGDWSECNGTNQVRECIDLNECSIETDRPIEIQNCEISEMPCVENWVCDRWNECKGGEKERDCIDLNDCGTYVNKPKTNKDCYESNNNDKDKKEITIDDVEIDDGEGEIEEESEIIIKVNDTIQLTDEKKGFFRYLWDCFKSLFN